MESCHQPLSWTTVSVHNKCVVLSYWKPFPLNAPALSLIGYVPTTGMKSSSASFESRCSSRCADSDFKNGWEMYKASRSSLHLFLLLFLVELV